MKMTISKMSPVLAIVEYTWKICHR